MNAEDVRYFLLWLHYSLLGGWIGGIFFMIFAFSPALDYSMVSKALSAQIQERAFRRFNLASVGACFLLLTNTFSFFKFIPEKNAGLVWKIFFSTGVMGIFAAYSVFVLLPKMERLKESIPALSVESQGQREFDRLLRIYTGLQVLTGLLGLFILYGSVLTF